MSELSDTLQSSPEQMIDVVVILGKGILWQKSAFSAITDFQLPENARWAYFQQQERNLFVLFMHMLTWVTCASSMPPSALGYVTKVYFEPYKTIT